jgi:CelD/BcsL family acetyltransferase involved in cellulose biosynthesis
LWFLRKNDRPVAFRLDLEVHGVYYHLKGGYDTAYAPFSPGLLLQHATVAHAFDRGLDRYEFLGADEDYKLKWTKSTHERYSFRVFKRDPRGTIGWLDRAVARPVAKRVLRRGH